MASPTLCQLYLHKFVLYCARSDERVPTSVGAEVIVVARQDLPRAAAAHFSTEHGPRVGAGAELSTMSTLTGARRRRADVRARPRAPAAVDCTTDRQTGKDHPTVGRCLFLVSFFWGGNLPFPRKKTYNSPPPNGCQVVCSKSSFFSAGTMHYSYITETFWQLTINTGLSNQKGANLCLNAPKYVWWPGSARTRWGACALPQTL